MSNTKGKHGGAKSVTQTADVAIVDCVVRLFQKFCESFINAAVASAVT